MSALLKTVVTSWNKLNLPIQETNAEETPLLGAARSTLRARSSIVAGRGSCGTQSQQVDRSCWSGEASRWSAPSAGAKSGWLPRLNYSESVTRGDNPVFVFSSLLTQHQFTERNFGIGALNRPHALNNFQSQLNLDQVIYDAGQARNAIRSAQLIERVSGEDGRRTQQDVIAGVVRTYYAVVLSGETLAAAKEAVRSAEADLKRAEAVRAAGAINSYKFDYSGSSYR